MRPSTAAMFHCGTSASPCRRWVSWPNQREHRIEEVKVSLETPPIEPLPPGYGLTPKPQVASALMTGGGKMPNWRPTVHRWTREKQGA